MRDERGRRDDWDIFGDRFDSSTTRMLLCCVGRDGAQIWCALSMAAQLTNMHLIEATWSPS